MNSENQLPAGPHNLQFAEAASIWRRLTCEMIGSGQFGRPPLRPPLGAHALALADLLPLEQTVRTLLEGPGLRLLSVVAVARQIQLMQVMEVAKQVLHTHTSKHIVLYEYTL